MTLRELEGAGGRLAPAAALAPRGRAPGAGDPETPPGHPGSLAILKPCEPEAPVFIAIGRLLILTRWPISPGKMPVPDLTGCSGFVKHNLGVGL